MKKRLLALLLAGVLIFGLVGCSGSSETPTDETNGTETENGEQAQTNQPLKVGMVTDEGGVHDQSFNQSAWEGLQRAEEELGIEASYVESKQDGDFAPNLETLLDSGNDLIWGIGFKLADAILDAAKNNPDQKYAIVDHSYGDETPDNVVCVMFKQEQPSFLVGYIAAHMTETNNVGFVGGIAGDIIWAFDYGFHAGVQYGAKELGKEITIQRQYAESFSDVAKGKAIAQQMYQQGADIVFHAAGDVGTGVIEAAKEQGKWAIGVDRDQNYLAPDNVLTSAIKRVDIGVFNVVQELVNGNFPGGETITYGLEHGGAVDIAPTSDKHVPQEILDKVEELKQMIINGELEIPYNEETYEEFLKTL